jgi:protein-disulfide isomerase
MNHNFANGFITLMLIIWVLGLAASKGHDYLLDRASAKAAKAIDSSIDASWQKLTLERVPVLGVPSASFKIVEFSDYQCPFCRIADAVLAKFVARHPNDAVVYRYDMPLQQIHRYAYTASVAANCAELQGIREPYQSLLFQHQREFATIDWTALAKQGGITNADSFAQCIRDETPGDHIRKDIARAESMGITGTPSFLVNGKLLTEGFSDERLESLYQSRKQQGFGHDFLRIQ